MDLRPAPVLFTLVYSITKFPLRGISRVKVHPDNVLEAIASLRATDDRVFAILLGFLQSLLWKHVVLLVGRIFILFEKVLVVLNIKDRL